MNNKAINVYIRSKFNGSNSSLRSYHVPQAQQFLSKLCSEGIMNNTLTLDNTVGAIKNVQSRETGNMGYTRGRQTSQKHNTIYCAGHHYTRTNTNNVNKT